VVAGVVGVVVVVAVVVGVVVVAVVAVVVAVVVGAVVAVVAVAGLHWRTASSLTVETPWFRSWRRLVLIVDGRFATAFTRFRVAF
jgi:hypothetical protein